MIRNEATYNKLYDGAVEIYKYFNKERGFYSGHVTGADGRAHATFNSFTGAKAELEKKMGRRLTEYEMTALSLAIGYGPTPVLTEQERAEAMQDLWNNKPNRDRECLVFDRLVTCI